MGYKENKKAYNLEYKKKNLKRVPLDLPIEKYEKLKIFVEEHSEEKTINGFIKKAIDEKMERDK